MINIAIPLVVAMGTNDKISADIHKMYLEKETVYSEIIQCDKSNGKLKYVETFSVKYAHTLEEAHAIVINAFEESTLKDLRPILKKGYLSLYKKFTESPKTFNFKAVQKCVGTEDVILESTTTEVVSIYAVLIYFNLFFEPSKLTEPAKAEMDILLTAYVQEMEEALAKARTTFKYTMDELDANVRQSINYLYDRYTIKKEFNMRNFLERVTEYRIEDDKEWQEFMVRPHNLSEEEIYPALQELQDSILARDKDAAGVSIIVNDILKYFSFFENKNIYKLNKEETRNLFYLVAKMYHNAALEESFDIEMLLIALVPGFQMKKEYETATDLYFEATSNELEKQIRAAYEEEVRSLDKQLERVTKIRLKEKEELISIKEQRKNAEHIIKAQEKELNQLHKMKEEFESLQQETIALRNFSYQIAKETDTVEDIPDEDILQEMLTFLKSKKIVVVGGETKWQTNLKEYLPDITFIAIDKKNSYGALKTPDTIIVINTIANKHANYYKMLSMRNQDNAICYFNTHTNMKLSIKSIYTSIQALQK